MDSLKTEWDFQEQRMLGVGGWRVGQRQREGKDGAFAGSGGDGERAVVRLEDGATDGQSHAGAGGGAGGGVCAVEALEDEFLFGGVDALTVVGDGEDDGVCAALSREEDGRLSGGVFGGVFEQVDEDFFDVVGVGQDERKLRNVLAEIVVGEDDGAGAHGGIDDGIEADGSEGHVDLLSVELGHFNGLGDEPVKAVGLFVDDGEQFVSLVGGEWSGVGGCVGRFMIGRGMNGRGMNGGVVEQEGRDRGFDGGERGAQLVGDGVDHERAEALTFLGGFGACDVIEGLCAVEGDADESADGLEGVGGELNAFDDEQAARADSDADGDAGFLDAEVRGGDGVGDGVGGGEGESVLAQADLVHGNGGWVAGEIAAVAVEQVEEHGVGVGDKHDGRSDGVEDSGDVFGLQQFATEAVKDFNLALAKSCVVRFFAGALGEPCADDGGGEKGEESQPVLRVVDDEGADGRQEEVVVEQGGDKGHDDGIAKSPARGKKKHIE